MATLRMAGGNLLGTVADTANAVSGIMRTVSDGVGILHASVEHIRAKQTINQVAEMVDYEDTVIADRSLEAVKREENIRNYIGNDAEKQQSFNNYSKKISAALEARRNKIPE